MIWLNVPVSQPVLFDHVPLSWVPPITSHEFDGLIATLMNCSVLLRLLSTWSRAAGVPVDGAGRRRAPRQHPLAGGVAARSRRQRTAAVAERAVALGRDV